MIFALSRFYLTFFFFLVCIILLFRFGFLYSFIKKEKPANAGFSYESDYSATVNSTTEVLSLRFTVSVYLPASSAEAGVTVITLPSRLNV